jgi:hypothetical protein
MSMDMLPHKIIGTGVLLFHILIHEVPFNDVKVGVWCAVNEKRIISPKF